jgi:hypothetical protein
LELLLQKKQSLGNSTAGKSWRYFFSSENTFSLSLFLGATASLGSDEAQQAEWEIFRFTKKNDVPFKSLNRALTKR